jgi:hypothetical protein
MEHSSANTDKLLMVKYNKFTELILEYQIYYKSTVIDTVVLDKNKQIGI